MTTDPKTVCLLFLLLAYSSESAAICKWTDKNGTVHYAETCPESENSTRVDIEPPRSQSQVEASQQRSEQMRRASQAASSLRALEQQQQSIEDQAVASKLKEMRQHCASAMRQVAVLSQQQPVYMDENGALHTKNSMHNVSYKGPRKYLDDQQRAAETNRFEQLAAQTCNADESDIRSQYREFAKRQNEGRCSQLEVKLAELKNGDASASPQDIDYLEQVFKTNCR